jgi:hypothetical protein
MRESLEHFTLANTAREYIRVYKPMLSEGGGDEDGSTGM